MDTWLLIRPLWDLYPAIQVAVSVTDIATNQLRHYLLTPDTILRENQWGIPEPVEPDQSPITSDRFNLVLVPLLTFDKQGNRVGYGKGFYDRFLANCRPDCAKVGLSLFEPVTHIEGIEPTDVRLDACITPSQICFFS